MKKFKDSYYKEQNWKKAMARIQMEKPIVNANGVVWGTTKGHEVKEIKKEMNKNA